MRIGLLDAIQRLGCFLGKRDLVKQEIDEELRFHLEQRTAENIAAGLTAEQAERVARRRFGNVQSVREECRDLRGASFGDAMLSDLRFGLRSLARSPGFTIVAVLMLAIGIGSATGMFSVLRAFVIKPYSTPNGDRLAHVWSDGDQPLSTPDYFDVREQVKAFRELGVYSPQNFNVGEDHPESVHGVTCTPGVLRAFGVAPCLGRWLEEADEQKGAPPVAVISHRLWRQLFGGNSASIGRAVRLDGNEVTVVGVMPEGFEFSSPRMPPGPCEIWQSAQLQRDQVSEWNCCTIGLLKEGVTLAAADAEIKAIGARLNAARADAHAEKPFLVRSLRFELTRYGSSYGWMIFGATVLVLLVACANVASMLLARHARRQGEFGVRIALGATPIRIFRLVFSETLLLSVAGTLAGAGLVAAGLSCFKAFAEIPDARSAAVVLDGQSFAFAAGLALLTALCMGIPPALSALRISVADLLRTDGRSATGSGSRHRLLRGLIVTQIAVAFILANLAVLFSASYAKMLAVNASLATDYVVSAAVDLHGARYRRNGAMTRFRDQLAERAAALPGVTAAGTTTDLPLEWGPSGNYLVNDEIFDPSARRPSVVTSAVTPGYFDAADIHILQGRTLQASDVGRDNIGIVVNRAFAEKYWPGGDALGKIIRPNAAGAWFHGRVVGVVENVRQWGVKSEPQPQLYWTTDRAWGNTVFLVVRSARPTADLAAALRGVVAELDPDLPLSRVRTFKMIVREATSGDRAVSGLTNYCMIVAIGLVAIGLYGTLSYCVLQRTREIGIRMALGAARGEVVRLVFRQGFGWVLMGITIGIGGALAMATALRALLYDLSAINPFSLAAAAGAVLLAATLACWFPARNASRVDPMIALRHE